MNFNIFGGFRKMGIFWGMKILWIFFIFFYFYFSVNSRCCLQAYVSKNIESTTPRPWGGMVCCFTFIIIFLLSWCLFPMMLGIGMWSALSCSLGLAVWKLCRLSISEEYHWRSSHYAVTHVLNKNSNIQGRSTDVVEMIFHTKRNYS